MIIVGCIKSNSGFIPLNLNNDDHITYLLSLGGGFEETGGCTFYIKEDSPKKSSKGRSSLVIIKKRVQNQHGNLQIRCYDHVLHGANQWLGWKRCVINFRMQKKVLQHFSQCRCQFFQQYVDTGFPSGDFLEEA